MGQEISHQSKSNIVKRHKSHQQIPQSTPQPQTQREVKKKQKPTSNFSPCKGKYIQHTENFSSIYAPSSTLSTTSTSSTDDEHYRQRQKYNLNKQTYEKSRIAKKLSRISNTTDQSTSSSTSKTSSTANNSTYQNSQTSEPTYTNIERQSNQHKRKSSTSTDSGIYYASCHCNSSFPSSSSANSTSSSVYSTSACGCAKSVASSTDRSRSSLDHTKKYLCHHLYIKSYLDILEEDEKARAQFKTAKPGGIRNYKPKILSNTALAASAPFSTGFSISSSNIKLREKCKEDPWI
ncbi:uncharacterized protein [Eurosta solidaginis]|uniref:uncharacterized protein n=1 Tax=Eurosta solidaginis TaxID=178769 RepID=UPI00353147C2